MDFYNSLLAKRLASKRGVKNWAITIWNVAFYSCSKAVVDADPRWRSHENWHKHQWKDVGFFKFIKSYMHYSREVGYDKNPFEIDAIAHETK